MQRIGPVRHHAQRPAPVLVPPFKVNLRRRLALVDHIGGMKPMKFPPLKRGADGRLQRCVLRRCAEWSKQQRAKNSEHSMHEAANGMGHGGLLTGKCG